MPPSSVLVIEDDALIRMAVIELLRQEGYEAEGAANGVAALRMLEGGARPGLILLDVMMPLMSGAEFRAELLKNDELAGLPLVVVTGDHDAARKARQLRAVDYLEKPFEPDALLDIVVRCLGSRSRDGAS